MKLAERFSVPFLGSLPLDPLLVKSGEEEMPFLLHWKDTETGKKMEEIIEKILKRRST